MNRWLLVGIMAVATAAHAQQVDLKSLDKFINMPTGVNVTQINLDESMLKAAANTLNEKKGDEAAAKNASAGLKGIYLRSFEFNQKGMYKLDDLKAIRDQLKAPDWTVFFQNREADEQTEIWVHRTKGEADGILLFSAEDDELTVVNAIGIGRPSDLNKIGSQFGIPQIGGNPKK
jgi:Domain of unknown function (DUF4252)